MSNKFDYILSPDGELYHWEKKDHKYISREKKNGEWVYKYPSTTSVDGGGSVASKKSPAANKNTRSTKPTFSGNNGPKPVAYTDPAPSAKKSSGSSNSKIDRTIANIKQIAEAVGNTKKGGPSDKSERSNGIDALLKEIDTLSTELKNEQSRSASDKSARVDKEVDMDEISRQMGMETLRGQNAKKSSSTNKGTNNSNLDMDEIDRQMGNEVLRGQNAKKSSDSNKTGRGITEKSGKEVSASKAHSRNGDRIDEEAIDRQMGYETLAPRYSKNNSAAGRDWLEKMFNKRR